MEAASQNALYGSCDRLVQITILGREFEVPAGNMMLRALQFLSPENVAMGRFCWNEQCQHCRISFRDGESGSVRQALACKLLVKPQMQVLEVSPEVRYCLRELALQSAGSK